MSWLNFVLIVYVAPLAQNRTYLGEGQAFSMISAGSKAFIGTGVSDNGAGDIRSVMGDLFDLARERDRFVVPLTVDRVTLWPVERQLFRNPFKPTVTAFECNESAAVGIESGAFIKLKTDVVVRRRIFEPPIFPVDGEDSNGSVGR